MFAIFLVPLGAVILSHLAASVRERRSPWAKYQRARRQCRVAARAVREIRRELGHA